MDSSIISGLIGGLITVVLVTYVSARLRSHPTDGSLRWGWGLVLLGLSCLAIVGFAIGAFFYDNDLRTYWGELFAVIALVVGFGFGAVYCLVEYFSVHGEYDDQGIEFHTPWTGTKNEKRRDLQSVEFNASMSWYVLEFRSGATIRLSNMLSGHGGVIQRVGRLGFDVE